MGNYPPTMSLEVGAFPKAVRYEVPAPSTCGSGSPSLWYVHGVVPQHSSPVSSIGTAPTQ